MTRPTHLARDGRLPVEPELCIELCRALVLALDAGRYGEAVVPIKRLRSYGLSFTFRPHPAACRREGGGR
jgi:hypothetical protein